MSAVERTHFPAIRTTQCTGSSDAINVEDLLCRAKRKPNQKTYRNRHINAVEQKQRNHKALQCLDVQGKGSELFSVAKKAAPKKQMTKRVPRKTLTLVKDIGGASSALQEVQERSDTAIDQIKTQSLRRVQKTPGANKTRKRCSPSHRRQTVKKSTCEIIDLKEFKFPQALQTPHGRRFLDWTPGSGFEDISLSSPTALTKRFRRRLHVDHPRTSGSRNVIQPRTLVVGDESWSAYRQEGEAVKRRLFAGGPSHNTATTTHRLLGESEKPAEVATAGAAVEDEQWQPLCRISQQEVQYGEGPALAEEVQNHQEALIRQNLAEEPSRKISSREWYHKTTTASRRYAESSHTVSDARSCNATNSPTPNRTQGIATESERNISAILRDSAYAHPPSSALQDPPIHNTQEAIPTSPLNGIAYFPYREYLHPPSPTLNQAATPGPEPSDLGAENADRATDKETNSSQSRPSKRPSHEEKYESPHEETEEPDHAGQNADPETESREGNSAENPSDQRDRETVLETDNNDMNNSRHSTAGEPDDEDMLDPVEAQQDPAQTTTTTSISTAPEPNTFTRPPTPQHLNLPTAIRPHGRTSIPIPIFNPHHQAGRARFEEEQGAILHLSVTPRLKRKLSEVRFRPPFAPAAAALERP